MGSSLMSVVGVNHQDASCKASTTFIRPMKFGDDKIKSPSELLFLAGAWLNLEPLRLNSTSAASESRPFSRDSRRDGLDDVYRYDVFQITLCHLQVYKFAIKPILLSRFRLALGAESEH
jgi:hypothetical protein